MRARAFLLLGLAVVLAIAAVFLVRDYLERQSAPDVVVEQAIPLSTVVVARTKLVFGNRIGREHLREVQWPVDGVPQGAFKTIDELLGDGEERVALRTIEAGEAILPGKVTGFGEKATLSAVIDKAMRAVTIRVNNISGVAGFVVPGDKVDILVTRKDNDGKPTTDILLQNVKVLGIDQKASEDLDKPSVAKALTLEVTPIQAQKLTLAQQVGQLSLVLRHVSNSAQAPMETITIGDLKVGEINRPEAPRLIEPVSAAATSQTAVAEIAKPTSSAVRKTKPTDNRVSISIIRGMALSVEKVLADEGARRKHRRPASPLSVGPTTSQAETAPIDLLPASMRTSPEVP